MGTTAIVEPGNKFSYTIDFRFKKFDDDLNASGFINSTLTITLDEPIPEPMQRLWTTIIREINPAYFDIEVIAVDKN